MKGKGGMWKEEEVAGGGMWKRGKEENVKKGKGGGKCGREKGGRRNVEGSFSSSITSSPFFSITITTSSPITPSHPHSFPSSPLPPHHHPLLLLLPHSTSLPPPPPPFHIIPFLFFPIPHHLLPLFPHPPSSPPPFPPSHITPSPFPLLPFYYSHSHLPKV